MMKSHPTEQQNYYMYFQIKTLCIYTLVSSPVNKTAVLEILLVIIFINLFIYILQFPLQCSQFLSLAFPLESGSPPNDIN